MNQYYVDMHQVSDHFVVVVLLKLQFLRYSSPFVKNKYLGRHVSAEVVGIATSSQSTTHQAIPECFAQDG